jgi:hypothetical protein
VSAESGVGAGDATPPAPEGPTFTATSQAADRGVAAFLSGTADLNAKKTLDDFLVELHETARKCHAAEVTVDFKDLKFMNSSCLKGMVTWICAVQELPPPDQYRIVLVSSPKMQWQKRSLKALSCLAAELVTIQS